MTVPSDSVDLEVEVPKTLENGKKQAQQEDSTAKMHRLAEEMRFRLKEAMAQRGGSEAFLTWLRSDDGKRA